jgi:predicted aspartyl protease
MTGFPSRRGTLAGLIGAGLFPSGALALPPSEDAATPDKLALPMTADIARRVTASVLVDGAGPFEFVIDTGANHTVVSTEIARRLALTPGPGAAVHSIAGVEQAPSVLIQSLRIGEFGIRKVQAPVLARARLGADGLVGIDVLKNRRMTIDFALNTLRIDRSEARDLRRPAPPPPSLMLSLEYVIPARFRSGQLMIVDAQVGGVPVTAFLDSGSQNTIGNLALKRALYPPDRPGAQFTAVQLISVTGQTPSGALADLPPLRLGGLRIHDMTAVFADLHVFQLWDLVSTPAILIGVDVMRHFSAMALDFGRKTVSIYMPRQRGVPLPADPQPSNRSPR